MNDPDRPFLSEQAHPDPIIPLDEATRLSSELAHHLAKEADEFLKSHISSHLMNTGVTKNMLERLEKGSQDIVLNFLCKDCTFPSQQNRTPGQSSVGD